MTLRFYTAALAAVALLGWGSAATIVLATPVSSAGRAGMFLFYVSLGMALAASFAFAGVALRRRREGAPEVLAALTLRQGTLLALAAVSLLFLQAHRWFTVGTGAAVVGAAIITEAIFLWQPWKRS